MTYWHGGPTIRRGFLILPAADTGHSRSDPDDPDGWVYVTPNRDLAATYAATCNGWVYEVVPNGELEQDPDSVLDPGESLRCRSATIVRRFRLSRQEREERANIVALLELASRLELRPVEVLEEEP